MALLSSIGVIQILQLAFVVPLGYVFLVAVYRRFFHPLAKYPGPFLASITRWWMVREVLSGEHDKHIRALHKKYGDIVRIAPNEVAIADPEAMKVIYSTGGGFTKGTKLPELCWVSFGVDADCRGLVYCMANGGTRSLFFAR